MTMIYDLNKINSLTAYDMEYIRQKGEDARNELSDAVTRMLAVPQNWCICAEYRMEFGGFFLFSAVLVLMVVMIIICAYVAPATFPVLACCFTVSWRSGCSHALAGRETRPRKHQCAGQPGGWYAPVWLFSPNCC